MPLRILCPQGHALVVSQARGGSTLRCPKCGASVVVPPAVPQREIAAIGAEAVPAGASESAALKTAAAITDEPEPPPVVTAIGEVAPPPVWAPPPKSRVIPDAAPTSPPPPPTAEGEKLPAIEHPLPPGETGAAPATSVAAPPEMPVATASPPAVELLTASAVAVPPPDVPAAEAPTAFPPPQEAATAPSQVIATDSSEPSSLDPLPLIPAAGQQLGAYILSICFVAAALFSAAPAVWDIVQYAQAVQGAYVARWALVVLALGVVQVAYAIYLAQLPDWTSGWVITLFALATAAVYAAMLGVTLIAGDDSRLIRSLQLTEFMATGRASIWCLCMTTIMAALAFFGGRTSLRWRLAEAAGR